MVLPELREFVHFYRSFTGTFVCGRQTVKFITVAADTLGSGVWTLLDGIFTTGLSAIGCIFAFFAGRLRSFCEVLRSFCVLRSPSLRDGKLLTTFSVCEVPGTFGNFRYHFLVSWPAVRADVRKLLVCAAGQVDRL